MVFGKKKKTSLGCEKHFKYDTWKAEGKVNALNLAEIQGSTEAKILRNPDSMLEAIDYYQYQRCKDAERYDDNSENREYYISLRDEAFEVYIDLKILIETFNTDPTENAKKIGKRVNDFISIKEAFRLAKQKSVLINKLQNNPDLEVSHDPTILSKLMEAKK